MKWKATSDCFSKAMELEDGSYYQVMALKGGNVVRASRFWPTKERYTSDRRYNCRTILYDGHDRQEAIEACERDWQQREAR